MTTNTKTSKEETREAGKALISEMLNDKFLELISNPPTWLKVVLGIAGVAVVFILKEFI